MNKSKRLFSNKALALRKKLKEGNQSKRDILIKAKYGNDTLKTNLGTNLSGAAFNDDNIDGARTEFKHTIDPCPAGEYVIEGYFEVDESVIEPVGRVYHNNSKKHESKAKKNGDNVFNFLEKITVVDVIIQKIVMDKDGKGITVDKVLGPHDFVVDFEEIAGEKVRMLRGSLDVYRINEYKPPERVAIPTPGIPDDYPIIDITKKDKGVK